MSKASTHTSEPRSAARRVLRATVAVLITLAALVISPAPALAQPKPNSLPAAAQGIDPVERVGESLPLNVEFKNAQGQAVKLGDYFKDEKPAIMLMVYYRCPVVCGVVMDKVANMMDSLDFVVGQDYRTLVFSFDPTETTQAADAKKHRYINQYTRLTDENRAEVEAGWEFHTGTETAIKELGDALGYPFKLLPDGEYSHSVVIFIITPKGVISRYVYGYDYPPREIKLSLLDASDGKIARTIGERILNYCYMYDPTMGKYVLHPFRVVQIAGGLTVLVLGALISLLLVGERRRRRKFKLAEEALAGVSGSGSGSVAAANAAGASSVDSGRGRIGTIAEEAGT
jgi:protein SCO1